MTNLLFSPNTEYEYCKSLLYHKSALSCPGLWQNIWLGCSLPTWKLDQAKLLVCHTKCIGDQKQILWADYVLDFRNNIYSFIIIFMLKSRVRKLLHRLEIQISIKCQYLSYLNSTSSYQLQSNQYSNSHLPSSISDE